MLYINGHIIQVLEGEQKAVEAFYKRIAQDPRHTDVTRVMNNPISHHLFGDWSMGYETITTSQLENINEIIVTDAKRGGTTSVANPVILQTLKAFYEHNRLR